MTTLHSSTPPLTLRTTKPVVAQAATPTHRQTPQVGLAWPVPTPSSPQLVSPAVGSGDIKASYSGSNSYAERPSLHIPFLTSVLSQLGHNEPLTTAIRDQLATIATDLENAARVAERENGHLQAWHDDLRAMDESHSAGADVVDSMRRQNDMDRMTIQARMLHRADDLELWQWAELEDRLGRCDLVDRSIRDIAAALAAKRRQLRGLLHFWIQSKDGAVSEQKGWQETGRLFDEVMAELALRGSED